MRVHVDLADELDVVEWTARHARGEVPDALPYGLNKLDDHGITPVFGQPLRHPVAVTLARKVRGRLRQHDFLTLARNAVRRERRHADAVLCWDERTGVPAALLPGGPPLAWSPCWLDDAETVPPAMRALTRRAMARTAGLFHFCEPIAEQLTRSWGLPAGSVHRLRMGVDEEYFRPMAYPGSGSTVMSVGDDRNRDHAALVRSIDGVIRSGVPATLELATTRPVEVPEHVGTVHRRRMEGAILDLYERCSVVAIAVRAGAGGSGLTALLEAMSCARPVVITGNPGLDEYVEDGVTGILTPPGDEIAFQYAVASLLKDPVAAAEMGRAGRRAVERNFTTGHLAADLAGLFRSIA